MLRFVVFDKDRRRVGWVNDPLQASATPRHNEPGDASFTVRAGHLRAAALAEPGARVRVEYKAPAGGDWMRLLSGPVAVEGKGHERASTRTFTVRDDKRLLWDLLGWPNPSGQIWQQGNDGTHWTMEGPAETVLKAAVAANAHRYAVPVVIAPDLGRGGRISVSLRMVPLADKLFPAVELAGLGVSVIQDDAGALRVDVYEPRVHTKVLTEKSGVLRPGDAGGFAVPLPAATRVVVGAGGEGEARVWREFVDHEREALTGMVVEVMRDARDVPADDPDLETKLAERAAELLAEGAAETSLELKLAETAHFRFGGAVNLGDRVRVRLAGSPVLEDAVREVQITWQTGQGLRVVPHVGTRVGERSTAFGKAIAALARGQRDILAGR